VHLPRFQTDGLSLHYTCQGVGLPVLCLSGLTRTGADFDYVAPHLPGIRLIRMDYRGRGQSDWADPMTYTVGQEAQDVHALLNHLGLSQVAILGSSRGGSIAMSLALTAKARLLGVALNDIGPQISLAGFEVIRGYVGHNPVQKTWAEAARARARMMTGFVGVPESRWLDEVKHHYDQTDSGLVIRYDPRLRDAVRRSVSWPDAWPLFDALAGLPLALIRGANSDLLTAETAAEMRRRRPDMVYAEVSDRGHIPFLDEPESLTVLRRWLEYMT
jgi:pimeloyl-ACP methyl ester carboxylesterase